MGARATTRRPKRAQRIAALSGAVVLAAALAACGTRESQGALEAGFLNRATSTAQAGGGANLGGGGASTGPTGGSSVGVLSTGTATTSATSGATLASGGGGGTSTHPAVGGGATSGGATSGGATVAASKCTGNEQQIVIGSVGEQTGVAGTVVTTGPDTVAAWVKYANAHGGLQCHQLKYIIADDGGDPSKNASLTQQLVEQNHVVAFVQNDSPLGESGSEAYLASHNIPVIGSETAGEMYYMHPNFFPQAPHGVQGAFANFGAIAKVMNANQKAHFGVVTCTEVSDCTTVGNNAKAAAAKAGITLIFKSTGTLEQPDYSSQCSAAKQAGVTALFIVLDDNSLHRFGRSCASVNYHPLLATGETVLLPDVLGDPNLNGMVFGSSARPWTDNSNASIALMNQVIRQYAPGLSDVGQAHLGWVSAQLFQYSSSFWPAKATITSSDILAGMDQVKNYDVGGTTGPLTFTAGKDAPRVTCFWAMAIKNGAFVTPVGVNRTCQ